MPIRLRRKVLWYSLAYIILLNLLLLLLLIKTPDLTVVIAIVAAVNVLYLTYVLYSVNLLIKPLQKISGMLDLMIENKSGRLQINSPSEIVSIVEKVNRLLDKHEAIENNLKEMQEKAISTQRWALLGKLASGMVHEINNPLDGVINCIHALRSRSLAGKKKKEYLDLILEGLLRIETITKRMLGLSREQPLSFVPTNLNELIEKALFFVYYRMSRKQISLRCKFTNNLPSIDVDQGSILQVLVNLFLNAIDSMSNGGVLSITTTVDEKWLKISVADSGTGMTQEVLDKIFMPFFTTKPEGIGLGLSICINLVERHMGEIDVESAVNKGSTFTVKLPLKQQ